MLELRACDRPQDLQTLVPIFASSVKATEIQMGTILSKVNMDTSKPVTFAQRIDDALTEKLIQQLAYHLGPRSRSLVRWAVETSYDLEQIIDILLRQLPGEAEREQFRKQFAV